MKQFLKYMLASTLGTVVGLFLIGFVSVAIVMGMMSALVAGGGKKHEVKIAENSVLVFDMSKSIVERARPNPFEDFDFEGFDEARELELREVLHALESAKTDENIKGVLLKGPFFLGRFATLNTLRDAIEDFKSSGKFVVAYEEVITQGSYYLASAADEVYLFKEGMIQLQGLSNQMPYFKRAMDKLDISATVIKGPNNIYKSAVEPFSREDMSEENAEQMNRILTVLWDDMCQKMAASRGITTEEINRIADELAIRKPEDAQTLHLVDGVIYYDELLANLREKTGTEADDDVEMISMADYIDALETNEELALKDEKSWELKEEIAVIYALGGITSGENSDEEMGSETISEAIREARLDEDIKAIVMRVNSPGGSALASDVIWREVKLAAETKPFIVSFGDVAASGGYYISTHADRIFAEESTITGSIGVFGLIPDVRTFLNERMGITFDGVKTNEHADFGGMKRGFDEAEMALLNAYVTDTYNEFVQRVAEGRGMTFEEVDSIARGRVWVGTDALENHLVDEIGGLEQAIAYAAVQAGLEDYELIDLPKQKDPWEEFFAELSGDARMTVAGWLLGDDETVRVMQQLQQVKKMEGIQARMLYDVTVQ